MKSQRNPRFFIIPLIVCVFSFILFVIFYVFFWMGHVNQTRGDYCEISSRGLFNEPINMWSSLSFPIIGLVIAWQMMWNSFQDNTNFLTRSDFMSILVPSLVIWMGPASMAMHASYTKLGVQLDHFSEYLGCAFLVAYSTQRFFSMCIKYFIVIFVLIIILCELMSQIPISPPIIGSASIMIVVFLLIISTVMEIINVIIHQPNIQKRWGIACLITFSIAIVVFSLSKTGGPLCYPNSFFQGHALWHVLVALAIYFLFRYYVSEHNNGQTYLIEEFD